MCEKKSGEYYLHEIRSRLDEFLSPWLDLYQEAFPLREQMRFSYIIKTLQQIEAGRDQAAVLLAVLDREPSPENRRSRRASIRPAFSGMVWYMRSPRQKYVALWYFAVPRRLRNRGIGGAVMRQLITRTRQEGYRAILFEVEHPDHVSGETPAEVRQHRLLAELRIAFYRRYGAKLAGNLIYHQKVGWQKPLRMSLMALPLADDVTNDELFAMFRRCYRDGLQPADSLALE
jgi:ribosomal protein S18 acetylase RimI-like enzyme